MSDVILKGLTVIQEAVDKMSPEEVHLRFVLSQHKKEIAELKQKLEHIHYYSDAYCLYELEKRYNIKREDIVKVEYSGGHGYTVATIYFNDGNSIIESDETLAGMLLAWFDIKTSGEVNDTTRA